METRYLNGSQNLKRESIALECAALRKVMKQVSECRLTM